jgi:hypothetical protein
MRSILLSWLVVVMAVLLAGCGTHDGPPRGGVEAWGNGAFASRVDAAKAIDNSAVRDEALSKLAIEAATGNDGESAKKAVEAITNTARKDEAASKAALKLAKAGLGDEANAIALLIVNSAVRDQALAKIAKGELGD